MLNEIIPGLSKNSETWHRCHRGAVISMEMCFSRVFNMQLLAERRIGRSENLKTVRKFPQNLLYTERLVCSSGNVKFCSSSVWKRGLCLSLKWQGRDDDTSSFAWPAFPVGFAALAGNRHNPGPRSRALSQSLQLSWGGTENSNRSGVLTWPKWNFESESLNWVLFPQTVTCCTPSLSPQPSSSRLGKSILWDFLR